MFVKWIDQKAGTYLEAACHECDNSATCTPHLMRLFSPQEGCTHGPKSLSDYGEEFFPCRAHSDIVCA
jgi:hypothetical protein